MGKNNSNGKGKGKNAAKGAGNSAKRRQSNEIQSEGKKTKTWGWSKHKTRKILEENDNHVCERTQYDRQSNSDACFISRSTRSM